MCCYWELCTTDSHHVLQESLEADVTTPTKRGIQEVDTPPKSPEMPPILFQERQDFVLWQTEVESRDSAVFVASVLQQSSARSPLCTHTSARVKQEEQKPKLQ